jgi:hypothetical protein
MNKITKESIESLLQPQDEPVLSIYMPTHRVSTPPHMQEDQIRYKNLLKKGRDLLKEKSDAHGIEKIYKQLESQISNDAFWQHMTEGLAIFVSSKDCQVLHLPIECDEHVWVGDTYDVAPLLAMCAFDQPYYLLALAMHNSKLYKGDMYGLEPVDIEFPESLEDALNIDEMNANSRTVKSREAPRGPGDSIGPHGEGDSQEAGHEERLKYLRIIDSKITDSNDIDTKLPLLIAGTENEVGDYKAVSQYPQLMEAFIHGNHTIEHPNELHAAAWQVVRDEIGGRKKTERVEKFNESKGVYKASSDIKDIEEAAKVGRVDTLLVNLVNMTRDTVSDAADIPMPKIVFPEEYDKKQIGELAVAVHNQGGEVFALDSESMPEDTRAAAIYRYAV